jgi:hypothetical protein
MRPRESQASATSGSGLFQREIGWSPTSAPQPTAAIGGHLVKTSASGPIPTSRYCDQSPSAISTRFTSAAASDPGTRSRSLAHDRPTRARTASARTVAPARSSITRSIIARQGHATPSRPEIAGAQKPQRVR